MSSITEDLRWVRRSIGFYWNGMAFVNIMNKILMIGFSVNVLKWRYFPLIWNIAVIFSSIHIQLEPLSDITLPIKKIYFKKCSISSWDQVVKTILNFLKFWSLEWLRLVGDDVTTHIALMLFNNNTNHICLTGEF